MTINSRSVVISTIERELPVQTHCWNFKFCCRIESFIHHLPIEILKRKSVSMTCPNCLAFIRTQLKYLVSTIKRNGFTGIQKLFPSPIQFIISVQKLPLANVCPFVFRNCILEKNSVNWLTVLHPCSLVSFAIGSGKSSTYARSVVLHWACRMFSIAAKFDDRTK